jgi:hypothetical protein
MVLSFHRPHRIGIFFPLRRFAKFLATLAVPLCIVLIFGMAVQGLAKQRSASTVTGSDPAQSLTDVFTAACRQDQTAFAKYLTTDNAQAYRQLPEEQRLALLKRFVLLDDAGKPLLASHDGHPVLRCEAGGVVSEMRFGETQLRDNLAFIPVTIPEGDAQQSVRFGLVRESGEWKVISVGLVLLDIPALAQQWAQADLQAHEQQAIDALRKIADALKSYQTVYGKLPEMLEQLAPPAQGGFSPENAGLLDAALAKGLAAGYQVRYAVVPASDGEGESERNKAAGFKIAATPLEYGKSGRRSFLLGSDGILRGADKKGAVATSDDPPIAQEQVQP